MEQIVTLMEDSIKKLNEVKDKLNDVEKRKEAIVRFMGLKVWYDGMVPYVETSPERYEPINEWAKYNTSWDQLMPVVEKIEQDWNININNTECCLYDDNFKIMASGVSKSYQTESKIESVFLAISDYCLTLKYKP